MSASLTVKKAWLATAQRPFWAALVVMAGVGGLVVAGQMVLLAPVMPAWRGLIVVVLSLIPELLGILGPVAVLVGSMSASVAWRDGGEYRGLMATGFGPAPVVKAAVLWGALVGVGVAACTHVLGPLGRGLAGDVVNEALSDVPLSPGVQLEVGGVFVGVAPLGTSDTGVVVAAAEWVAWAEEGTLEKDGVRLRSGKAQALDDAWRIRFKEAYWPLPQRATRPHNFSRTTSELKQHIARLRDAGRDTARAELTLLKRSTLALSAPLFAAMGVCLAFARQRPMRWAVALVLAIWVLQRVADHGIGLVDVAILAGAPMAVLSLAAVTMLLRVGRPA